MASTGGPGLRHRRHASDTFAFATQAALQQPFGVDQQDEAEDVLLELLGEDSVDVPVEPVPGTGADAWGHALQPLDCMLPEDEMPQQPSGPGMAQPTASEAAPLVSRSGRPVRATRQSSASLPASAAAGGAAAGHGQAAGVKGAASKAAGAAPGGFSKVQLPQELAEPPRNFATQTRANALDPSQLDPKRAKRIVANRQSAHRSRMRKLVYITELENRISDTNNVTAGIREEAGRLHATRAGLLSTVQAQQAQVAALRAQVAAQEAYGRALAGERERLKAHAKAMLVQARGGGSTGGGTASGPGADVAAALAATSKALGPGAYALGGSSAGCGAAAAAAHGAPMPAAAALGRVPSGGLPSRPGSATGEGLGIVQGHGLGLGAGAGGHPELKREYEDLPSPASGAATVPAPPPIAGMMMDLPLLVPPPATETSGSGGAVTAGAGGAAAAGAGAGAAAGRRSSSGGGSVVLHSPNSSAGTSPHSPWGLTSTLAWQQRGGSGSSSVGGAGGHQRMLSGGSGASRPGPAPRVSYPQHLSASQLSQPQQHTPFSASAGGMAPHLPPAGLGPSPSSSGHGGPLSPRQPPLHHHQHASAAAANGPAGLPPMGGGMLHGAGAAAAAAAAAGGVVRAHGPRGPVHRRGVSELEELIGGGGLALVEGEALGPRRASVDYPGARHGHQPLHQPMTPLSQQGLAFGQRQGSLGQGGLGAADAASPGMAAGPGVTSPLSPFGFADVASFALPPPLPPSMQPLPLPGMPDAALTPQQQQPHQQQPQYPHHQGVPGWAGPASSGPPGYAQGMPQGLGQHPHQQAAQQQGYGLQSPGPMGLPEASGVVPGGLMQGVSPLPLPTLLEGPAPSGDLAMLFGDDEEGAVLPLPLPGSAGAVAMTTDVDVLPRVELGNGLVGAGGNVGPQGMQADSGVPGLGPLGAHSPSQEPQAYQIDLVPMAHSPGLLAAGFDAAGFTPFLPHAAGLPALAPLASVGSGLLASMGSGQLVGMGSGML